MIKKSIMKKMFLDTVCRSLYTLYFQVEFTTRQVASHLSGIRHYDKNCDREEKDVKNKSIKDKDSTGDSKYSEFYSRKSYKSTNDSLEMFKHDELCFKPGINDFF